VPFRTYWHDRWSQASTTAYLGTTSLAELEPRNFLQPCLLLLLREQPDHGYELAARLRPMHDGDGDAGGVYRTLRSLERLGLVRSEWQTSAVGPARRTYYITPEGVQSLEAQADGLRHTDEALHVFLERYARVVAAERRGCPEGSRDDYRGEGNGSASRVRPPRSSDPRARH
jgi:PadR family transcriptional regulator, regulatory protein PadR